MKKIILVSMMLAIVNVTFSQETTTSPTLTKQDYLLKSKHQKTAAWILLGGGILIGSVRVQPNPDVANSTNAVFIATGVAAIGCSIVLFVASSKNKRKAMSMSFKNEAVPKIYKSNWVYNSIPSVSLKFKL